MQILKKSLPALAAALATSLTLVASPLAAQTTTFAPECAAREIALITMIEDRGQADNIAPEVLSDAALSLLRARAACYAGRVSEALATYDRTLLLTSVASAPAR
ncbi:MAG TPA: hypothetical protein VGD13_06000 [Xanthobacteraceae bacterium]